MELNKYNIKYQIETYVSAERAFVDVLLPRWNNNSFISVGRELPRTKLRPRELLGLIILCHVAEFLSGDRWRPGADPFGHDGVVTAAEGARLGEGMVYEQVYAMHTPGKTFDESIEQAIHRSIQLKSGRGSVYIAETSLIVFLDRTGKIEDLRQLSLDVQHYEYHTIYLIARNGSFGHSYVCMILKSPRDPLGPIEVVISAGGSARVRRLTED